MLFAIWKLWLSSLNRHSLGTTGIEISPVILGCGTFGGIGGAKALIGRGLNREAAVATLADGEVGKRFDREFIQRKLAMSLQRLGVDSVSFYLSHGPDPETPIEQTLEGFAAGIESKQVRHIGCCNVDGDQLRTALEASDRLGLPAFEWVQNGFSLLSPKAYDEVRNICAERNLVSLRSHR